MEVILLERIEKLGAIGDVVKVKNGYGRNFLIPRKKALRATNENKAYFEARRAEIERKNEESRQQAAALAAQLDKVIVTLIMQAGEDGRLFGSVTARNITNAVTGQSKVTVDHKTVSLNDSIKYLGVYPIRLALHSDVSVTIHVNIARSEAEADEAKREFLNPSKKKATKEQQAAEEFFAPEASEDEVAEKGEEDAA